MRTPMIGVFKFLNIVNVLHSKDAIMGSRREEKSPWFSSRCRLPESLNKKTNKQTNKPQNRPSTHATQAVLSHLH